MLIIAGTLTLEPGRREAFLTAAHDTIAQARQAQGCLDFVLSADPLAADRVYVFERWESPRELLAFRGDGPSEDDMSVVVAGDVARYEIASVGPP
ncbi:hypothetical protein DSM112329_03311 [Paraconexibacter sp. AEG42_29]|uniref:ABM domain-containing protein n=1 Tax=Paraconexibacter sp. AEG42_29 TaxID=2997339 RepID=A0AAU7AYF0_9ACTN